MKFSCDQCKTKYTIADERVRGKVLKIRCKNCSHIITVREEAATASPTGPKAETEAGAGTGPAAAPRTPLQSAMDQALKVPPAAAMHGSDVTLVGTPDALIGGRDIAALRAPAVSEQEEWHISVDGVAAGPFRLEALAQRVIVERAAGDQEIFIWRDGFDDWQPPGEVPEVRAAVERLRPGLPRSFWGERGGPPKVEVAEFNEEPPTLAISLKGGQKPAAPVQAQAQARAPSPVAALFSPAPAPSFKPAASVPGPVSDVVSGPSRKDVLGEVLASLNQQDSAATPPGPPEPAAPPPAAGGPDLNIAEPSMVINLATLAARMRTTTSGPHALPVSTSGAHPLPTGAPSGEMAALPIGAPTSGTGLSQVVVVTGPAPPAPGRHLKLMLSAAILLCVVLLGTVSYLLLNRGQVAQPEDKKDQGKAVTDRPVSVGSDPQATVDKDAGKKGEGGAKKRVPGAAQGKPKSLTSGQDSLAKLYEEQGVGSSTHLPKVPRLGSGDGPGGGGISATGLQDVVRKNQKSIQACYDRVLKRDPTLSRARIDVTVKVGISGTVTHVSISSPYSGTELGSCIQTAIKRWFFPPSDSDYETQFPLLLQAS